MCLFEKRWMPQSVLLKGSTKDYIQFVANNHQQNKHIIHHHMPQQQNTRHPLYTDI